MTYLYELMDSAYDTSIIRENAVSNGHVPLIDFNRRSSKDKGGKDRIVPFPLSFKEVFLMYVVQCQQKKAVYLFESSWKKNYSDRGIRKILMRYTREAGIKSSISPHKLRRFLLTWLKKQGIDDALIQPYSGHESRQSEPERFNIHPYHHTLGLNI